MIPDRPGNVPPTFSAWFGTPILLFVRFRAYDVDAARDMLRYGVRRTAFWVSFATIVSFLSVFSSAMLAQQSTVDLTTKSLEDLMNIQVYAASKHEQSATDAPSSVTVITADEIQQYGYQSLADILETVRGFYITNDRYQSYVGARGFGRLGDWNSRILLLVDGHRINDNVLGQAFIGLEFPVDIDLIQRIEIIRGPSSSLYGAEAFFAVIDVITRKENQPKREEISFAAGSFGSYGGRATSGGEYKGAVFSLSGSFYSSIGPTLFFPEFDSPATNYGVTSNTNYESYQRVLATITRGGFTLQGVYNAQNKGVPTAYFDSRFNDPRTRNLQGIDYLDLRYEHTLGQHWELDARTSVNKNTLYGPVAYDAAPAPPDTYAYNGQWWDSEIKLSRSLPHDSTLNFGAEITDNFRLDEFNLDPDVSPVATKVSAKSVNWAGYAQFDSQINRKFSVSAGVRYDYYNSGFGGSTNPRVALIYHPASSTTAKLLYGSAFRAPVPYESNPDYGPFYVSNPKLQPEKIRSVEGILEQGLGSHVQASASVFYNRITNLITLETDPNTELSVYENSQAATTKGVEVELSGGLATSLTGRASYTYTHTVDLMTGQTPPNSPANLVKLNLTMPFLHRKFSASLDGQYTGEVTTLGGNTLGGFSVLNATLIGHMLGKRADISASVYNLLDKKYSFPGRPEDPEDALPQGGTTFRIKLTYRFNSESGAVK
jgi:outer membrane receptor for ferrienterochelin and colicins